MNTVVRSVQLSQRSMGAWAIATAFVTGALLTVLSGCKLGNNIAAPTSSPTDPVTGFYGTQPQTLTFCASHPATECNSVATNQIPQLIATEMTNPVAFILADATTGQAEIVDYTLGKTALPIWMDTDNTTLSLVENFAPNPIWQDGKCTMRLYLEEEGTLVPGESKPVPNTTRFTMGRITLTIRVTQVFENASVGACQTTLQAMSNCYQDISQCGGADAAANKALQTEVQNIFETYIQAKVITAAEIATATNIAYEIQYQ
ncbi:hypothetical protein WDW37_17895 [Bdellovibrionota bacterium FG-1]